MRCLDVCHLQFILAMEKRVLTDRFALRFATTMHGILFVDAFFAFRYFKNELADFREELSQLAYSLMHNPEVEPPVVPGSISPPKQPKAVRRASPNSGGVSSSSGDGLCHVLVKMKALPNWVGGKDGRERCMICNKKTLWCCNDCSNAPHALMPICPVQSNKHGNVSSHMCYERHCAEPNWMPKGRAPKGGKRRRACYDNAPIQLASSCDGESCSEASDSEH